MADIKNKNELKRRIDLFMDELDYSINEEFCKETMMMMREFIGRASHLLDCADSKIKKAKKTSRKKAIDDFANTLIPRLTDAIYQKDVESMTNLINDVARELKVGVKNE